MIRSCFLFALSVAVGLFAFGQKTTTISGNFVRIPAENFFRQIEERTSYHFYYDAKQMDSVVVNLVVNDQPLEEVLKQAFGNTDIHFAIDQYKRVFITRKVQLISSLPSDFFKTKTLVPATVNKDVVSIPDAGPVKKTVSENKIYEVGIKTNTIKQGNAIVSGHIRNERSGEPIVNASVFADRLNIGAVTDPYGYYSLTLPAGKYIFNVQAIGMRDAKNQVVVYGDGRLDLELKEQVSVLKEVVVSTKKISGVNRIQMGVEHLNIDAIRRVPTVFGEADVMRVVLTLPGVKTVGEVSAGFNVRGGSADQNLVLLNGSTIYNPSHFFGMFSASSPEIVKDIELYKSSIPAKYGGRLSSVLDITLKEGNKKEFTGLAGIGLVTSRFYAEGPLKKDRTSFIVSGRSTYANWLLKLLPHPYDNSKASFNDGNMVISHRIDSKNDLYLNAYFSNDHFNLASDTSYGYGNRNAGIKWKHNFSTKLLAYISAGLDSYQYKVSSDKNQVNAYSLDFGISQLNVKSDFNYSLSAKHNLDFGAAIIRYLLHPGSFQPKGKLSLVKPDVVAAEQAFENALYISDRYTISPRLTVLAGLRYSMFNYLGPQEINYYANGQPRDKGTVVGTTNFSSGKLIKTYDGPEIRASLRYAVTESFSIKAGYNSMRQYIHMLSNTTAIAPIDIWKLTDPNIKPQQGNQISFGLYKNLKSNTIETSVEVYYKTIKDYLDYKPGASLILNHHVETEVVNTKGKAYGAELLVKKTVGKLNGWISYTYSRTLLKLDDSTVSTPVNNGNWYPANYDKPHDFTAVGDFKINHRFSMSMNITYSTGRPVTLPVGRFYYGGSQRVLYSDRNAYRVPDYFRIDFSMNIDGNYKVKQKTHNSWTIGVYNLTGRKNPYSVYYVTENGRIQGYRLSIFGSIIPFVNFNIRF
jgi:CarboxypepD_reg-like domain/TonB-dependent Receptor Plug Domain